MVKQGLMKVASLLEIPVSELYDAKTTVELEKNLVRSEELFHAKKDAEEAEEEP